MTPSTQPPVPRTSRHGGGATVVEVAPMPEEAMPGGETVEPVGELPHVSRATSSTSKPSVLAR